MSNKVIEAGWLVEIDTYENDGDFSATDVLNITSKEELDFVVEVASEAKGHKIGNLYDPSDEEYDYFNTYIWSTMRRLYPSCSYLQEEEFEAGELLYDHPLGWLRGKEENQFTRRVTEVRVFQVPEKITLERVDINDL